MLIRYSGNPIIAPDPSQRWYTKKAYNSTVVKRNGTYFMLFRAVGDDWVSRLMLAESQDGTHFSPTPNPVIVPEHSWEQKGCEDPRMLFIDGKYWVTYTAFDGTTARAAITSSTDLHTWTKHGLMFPQLAHPQREALPGDWSKAAAIVPERIDNTYYALFGDNHIWSATSTDLEHWQSDATPIISAREGYFDAAYVEMGPSPIKTERGWLAFYHGINEFSENRVYSLGAVLLDLHNPLNVIWRSSRPILTPTEPYETVGLIDMVPGGYAALQQMGEQGVEMLAKQHALAKAVFCCGAVLDRMNSVLLYYGAADTRICTARVDLDTIFNS